VLLKADASCSLPSVAMHPPHLEELYRKEARIRDLFNRFATEGRTAEMERNHRPMAEKLIARMQLRPSDSVLDIGCGDGWFCRLLAALCPQGAVVGIDLSDEMIDLARRKSDQAENILFAVGPAEEIPWAEAYFQHVLSMESAYFWPSPERAVREIFRVAAFGGRFSILMHYYRENPHAHHWQQLLDVPLQLKSAGEWAEVFRGAGFHNVETAQQRDDEPIPADFQPDPHWRSREEREAFQRLGALLVTGHKPDLPPPGPISPAAPPQGSPDPFRILK
jgi:ubiquinone/menaquinone biosynthesis C-methylase UbiE